MCLMSAASETGYRGGGGQTDNGGEGKERFVGLEEYFVSDARFNWELVKADESGGDVLPGLGAGEDPGNRVLHILKPRGVTRF